MHIVPQKCDRHRKNEFFLLVDCDRVTNQNELSHQLLFVFSISCWPRAFMCAMIQVTTSPRRFFCAYSSGVRPLMSCTVTVAPYLSRACTDFTSPLMLAKCIDVRKFSSHASTNDLRTFGGSSSNRSSRACA